MSDRHIRKRRSEKRVAHINYNNLQQQKVFSDLLCSMYVAFWWRTLLDRSRNDVYIAVLESRCWQNVVEFSHHREETYSVITVSSRPIPFKVKEQTNYEMNLLVIKLKLSSGSLGLVWRVRGTPLGPKHAPGDPHEPQLWSK